jgi:hypothetical protein
MEYCDKRALTSILSYPMWAIFQGMEAKENQQITIVFWLAINLLSGGILLLCEENNPHGTEVKTKN